jgi:hypothetical protein
LCSGLWEVRDDDDDDDDDEEKDHYRTDIFETVLLLKRTF